MIHSTDLPDTGKAYIQTLEDPLFEKNQIDVHVLRLDKIHTIVSGNKWFKLKYYLQDAVEHEKKGIVTFGGPYSNHLLATAYACSQAGLSSIGIVRGEEPAIPSATLRDMQSYGMKLQFVSRHGYNDQRHVSRITESYPDYLIVNEGGRGQAGIKGAEDILHLFSCHQYSHILCSVGTGTMISGIINSTLPEQAIIGIPSLKFQNNSSNTVVSYISSNSLSKNFVLMYDFHFGGYAKRNNELIQFMNAFYRQHSIPSDFVYTGKLFYAAISLIKNGFFKPGAKIILIHSGGLQGNRSLPVGLLDFSY